MILNEKSPFKIIQNPKSETIGALHINPHRCKTFELVILIQPANLVR
jgi:hypothetical protein